MYNEYNRQGYSYGYPRYKRENTVVDDELITLNAALELIKEAIKEEKQNEFFYESIIAKAPDENAKDILSSIRDDEKKHNEILRFIYSNISGEVIENPTEKVIESKETKYYEDLETALLKDVALVKKYRKIMGAMPTSRMHTLVMSILTDKLRHSALYNYLMNKAKN